MNAFLVFCWIADEVGIVYWISATIYVTSGSKMSKTHTEVNLFCPFSLDELRQAIMAMMNRKNELEEQNR